MLRVQAPKIHHLDGGFSPMREIRQPQLSFSPYLQVLGVLLLVVFAGFSVSGQTNFGRISGTVTDSSGAVVPSATVTVTNAATNAVRTTTTDEGGFYTVTNLPVGTYTVTVERSGFKKANQTDNALTADQRLTVNVALEAGAVSETVDVSTVAGETVNTTSGELARVVDKRQVQNLALNGRNYMQLVTLIPGAAILDENQLALTTSLSISQAAINGNRPNYNSLSVDGGFNMDSGSNNSQVNNVGIDFIQEVKIQTSNFSAEYGRNAGAAINVVTRGGGNDFHGAIFEFLRNDKLDARSFFSPVRQKLRFNNFGWNFNGPIKKDKFFFFAGQEWKYIRQDAAPVRRNMPTRAERLGDFSLRSGVLNVPVGYTAINPATGAVVAAGQPIPGRNLANLRLNGAAVGVTPNGAAIAAVYTAMEKLAVAYSDTPTANNATFQQPNPFNYREDNVRLDYRFNEKHSIYGRYLHDHYDLIDPFGTFIDSQLPTIATNRLRPGSSYQVAYTGTLAFNTIDTRSTGNPFADALLGNFRSYSEADNDPIGFFRFNQYEGYVTDSWKITRNLSLEFGARYYHFTPTYTQANNIANFDPSRYDPNQAVTVLPNGNIDPTRGGNRFNGLIRAGSGIPTEEQGRVSVSPAALALIPAGAPRGFYQPSNRLAPRFGFAYAPFGDGKTSIRGGFGMFYDKVEGNLIFSQVNLPPFVSTPNFDNGNLANPSGGTPSSSALIGSINAIDPNLKIPYSMNFSLGVQRELPRGFFVEATYVGNNGRHLIRQPDLNQPSFAALNANLTVNGGPNVNINALRPFKGYNQILYRLSDANSNYNGLQLYAAKRKGNLELTASYTWSKALTDTSGNGDGLDVGEDPFNRHANYGPASFDRRQIFVTTYDYRLPFFSTMNGVAGAVLSGWEVSGITRYQSGAYFTVIGNTSINNRRATYIGGPVLLPNPGPDGWINPAAFQSAATGVRGNSGVGTVQGPNLQTWDFSLRKQFAITERVNVRFQADMFNAFNRANFRAPNFTINTLFPNPPQQGFGTITTTGPARNIQFGLKLNF